MVRVAVVSGLLLASVLIGCAPRVARYASELPANMVIATALDRRPDVTVAFDVHHINRGCELDFDGRINLKTGSVSAGLPTGVPLYLEFIFTRKKAAIRKGGMVVLRKGSRYSADVSYVKGVYSAEIYESRAGEKSKRKLEMTPLPACKSS